MAPVEDLRAHSVVKTGRRHQRYNDAQIRKRDGGGRGDGGGNGNNGGNENRGNDGNENGGNGGNENGGNGGRKNEDGNKNKSSEDDDGAYPPQQAQNSPYRYDDPPQQTYPLATATIQRTTTAWIAPPTTTVTVPATFSNSPSFQPQFNQPSSAAPVSTSRQRRGFSLGKLTMPSLSSPRDLPTLTYFPKRHCFLRPHCHHQAKAGKDWSHSAPQSRYQHQFLLPLSGRQRPQSPGRVW